MRVRGKPVSCCFTGHRPAKLPWGTDEGDERCLRLKARLREVIARAVEDGYTHFICGMAEGCDLYCAEAVLALGEDREQKAPTDVIAAVGEFIAAHLHQDISLTQIADAVGLNPSYLSRLFKAETGGNISAAILNAKMDKARAMLQSDKYKIQDIADALGFNTPSYFSHLFRKVTRMSPNEYREHYMKSKGK